MNAIKKVFSLNSFKFCKQQISFLPFSLISPQILFFRLSKLCKQKKYREMLKIKRFSALGAEGGI